MSFTKAKLCEARELWQQPQRALTNQQTNLKLRRATTTHLESRVAIAPLRLKLPHKESIKSYVYADVKPKRSFKKMSLFNTYSRGEITNVMRSLFGNKHWFYY